MSRLELFYKETVAKQLNDQFNYPSAMQIPRIEKITLNMGLGDAAGDKKLVANAVRDMEQIAGQKVVVTLTKKAIAGFKVREEMPVGCMVTLRRDRMYEFFDRLVSFSIPRIRDFRGLSPKGFDGRGNYNMGLTEQIMFPEIDYDKIDKIRGMNISITTSAKTDEEGLALLSAFSFPFKKK